MSELQSICPGIQRNNLFVDGLFSCTLLKMNERMGEKLPQGPDETAILRLSQNTSSLLDRYWHSPSNKSEMPTYLAIGRSFISFVRSQFGKAGIASMMKQLAHAEHDTLSSINLIIKRNTVHELEAKWLTYLKYKAHSKNQISSFKFTWQIVKLCIKSSGCLLLLALLFFMIDVGCYIYNAITFGEVTEIASLAAQERNITHMFKLVLPASLLLGTVVIRCLSCIILTALLSCVAVQVSHSMRRKMITCIYCKPLEDCHDSLINIFSQDVAQLEIGIGFAMINVVRGIVVSVTSIAVITALVWPLGLPLAILFLGVEILLTTMGRRLGHYTFQQEHATARLSSVLREIIDGHLENRIFGLFGYWTSCFERLHAGVYKKKAIKSLFVSQIILVFHFFVPLMLTTGVLLGGFTLVIFGLTSFNLAMTSFLLFASAASALRVSGSFLPTLETAKVAMGRILAHCDNAKLTTVQPSTHQCSPIGEGAAVKLEGVSFAYSPNSAFWQLHNMNLVINSGERVAIVGPSGSGKSTLLKVVMGYYMPTEGTIYMYGHNLTKTNISSLPVSVVAQNAHFFHHMSIIENLQLANKFADYTTITEATMSSGIHDWICSLPQGYDTVISNDFSMSNGQRQRLALARSLLKQPQLLILDEVTSALDPTTSKAVFQKIMEVSQGMTVVAVTHSLQEAKMFDRIVFVSHGVIKECGSHRELMSTKGYYFHMWKKIALPEGHDQPVMRESILSCQSEDKTYHPANQRRRLSLPSIHIGSDIHHPMVNAISTAKGKLDTLEEVDTQLFSTSSAATSNSVASSLGVSKQSNCCAFAAVSKVGDKTVQGSLSNIRIHPQPMQSSTPKFLPILNPDFATTEAVNSKCCKLTYMDTSTMSTSHLTGVVLPVPPSTPCTDPQDVPCLSILQANYDPNPVPATPDIEDNEDPVGPDRAASTFSRANSV